MWQQVVGDLDENSFCGTIGTRARRVSAERKDREGRCRNGEVEGQGAGVEGGAANNFRVLVHGECKREKSDFIES